MFIIVRHGNTFEAGETPRRIGARTDLPLTQAGLTQASALGQHFAARGWRFSRVLVSPLQRTRQTAEAIMAEQGAKLDLEEAEFLREIDHGPDEDQPEDAVRGRIGSDALAAWEREATVPDGWEADAEKRIAAWRELLASQDAHAGPVLLVTSNGAARFALLAEPALQAEAARLETLKLPTGGYGVIERDASGNLMLDCWGLRP